MESIVNAEISTDDEEFTVCVKSTVRRKVLADSSDDEDTKKLTKKEPSQSPGRKNSVSESPKGYSDSDSKRSDVSSGSDNHSSPEKPNRKVFSKTRILRDSSDSEDDIITTKVQSESENQHESNSDSENKLVHKRTKRKDKMLEKIRKTFNKDKNKKFEEHEKIMKPLSTLCDKESSNSEDDAETGQNESLQHIKQSYNKENVKQKTNQKSIREETKPMRMSAKDAMENMTKIKSVSNRMLREKRVSLPYHRPKQLSLKEILNRKRPEIPPNNKPLSFKMNSQQLEQYALQLEESQKHLSELYKSDDDGDDDGSYHENKSESNPRNEETVENGDIMNKKNCEDGFEDENRLNVETNSDKLFDVSINNNENATVAVTTSTHETVEVDSQNITLNFSENLTECSENYIPTNIILEKASMISNNTVESSHEIADNILNCKTFEISTETTDEILCDNTVDSSIEINKESVFTELTKTQSAQIENETDTSCDPKLPENSNSNDGVTSITQDKQNNSNSENISLRINSSDSSNMDESNNNEDRVIINNDSINLLDCCGNGTSDDLKEADNCETTGAIDTKLQQELPIDNTNVEMFDDKDESDDKTGNQMDEYFMDDFDDNEFDSMMEKIENRNELGIENSPMLLNDSKIMKPKLRGAPGMVIDLDAPKPLEKKLSGVDMLKQRFIYFSQMKTPEEIEREKETKVKPGQKHLRLKQELEKQIKELSVAEWTKRIEEEREQKKEVEKINGELSESEDELEKLEKEIEENDINDDDSNKKETTPLFEVNNENDCQSEKEEADELEEDEDAEENLEEEENFQERKKSSIKKNKNSLIDDEAEVEDDEEELDNENDEDNDDDNVDESESSEESSSDSEEEAETKKPKKGRIIAAFEDSDDEEAPQKMSENRVNEKITAKMTPDLFESEGDVDIPLVQQAQKSDDGDKSFNEEIENINKASLGVKTLDNGVDMESIVAMCSGKFPSSCELDVPSVPPSIPRLAETETNTQVFGEDIVQMCSGRFDDDLVTTQTLSNTKVMEMLDTQDKLNESDPQKYLEPQNNTESVPSDQNIEENAETRKFFESALEEIGNIKDDENLAKGRKLVIESSDEENEQSHKKKKKKKLRKRALQMSDDEEDELEAEGTDESELEEEAEDVERIIEYDSEENEVVEVVPSKRHGYKGLASRFVEREAELSSEEEWAGSGDEDERGLDAMEREAGDDDVFHQATLRRQLGQMHMEDLMEQDEHEVRMLKEILLDDDGLEGGARQRRFRWNNLDEEEARGTVPDAPGEEGEEERETEEWRKQRHERQVFLNQLAEKQKEKEDLLGLESEVSSVIASALVSKTVVTETSISDVRLGDKKHKDVPSPVKNSFSILQTQMVRATARQSSVRRLAALLQPTERAVSAASSKRSFVFATLTQETTDDSDDLPRQNKKPKLEEKNKAGSSKTKPARAKDNKPIKSILQHLDV